MQRSSIDARDRVMRVFVSSTFRDMQAERDELTKRIFPKLRELCEQRDVVWAEVDLRWGVTDEERAEGRVLPICLEEIRDCRPYFIGLLGGRYGWILDEIPEDLIEREPWLKEHLGRSVTELEILHGALNEPSRSECAFFYFRDPTYIDRLPAGEDRDAYRSESPEAAMKLADLKERIRKSGYPVCAGYQSPQALGDRVLADLTAVMEQRFPAREEEPLNSEARLHHAFQKEATRVYVAREYYDGRLAEHLAGDGPPLVVTGPPGSGKSALLAHWVRAIEARAHNRVVPGGVIAHYAAASPRGGVWFYALERIALELARGTGITLVTPSDRAGFAALFASVLMQSTGRGRTAIVIDGVDELESEEIAAHWLPFKLPVHARLIISTGPGPLLELLRERGWSVVEVQPLSLDESRRVVTEFLAEYRKRLAEPQAERIARAECASNPLYIRTVLEELRLLGHHEELEQRIAYYLQAPDLASLLARVLQRYEEDFDRERPHLVGEAFSLVSATRRGLAEIELRDIMGSGGEPLPEAQWSPLRLAARHFFAPRLGFITFSCAPFREAVEKRYLPTDDHRLHAHERLADYFAHRFEKSPMGSNIWAIAASLGKPMYDYRRAEELPFQLAAAGRWKELATVLTDWHFLDTAWRASPADVRSWWSRIENATSIKRSDAYREAIENPGHPMLEPIGILLQEGGYPQEALVAAEGAERAARLYQWHRGVRSAATLRALVLSDLGRLEEAAQQMRVLEDEARREGDTHELARMLVNRSVVDVKRGATAEASVALEEAAALAAKAGDSTLEATALLDLAYLRCELGHEEQSLSLVQRAELLLRMLGDSQKMALVFSTQARIQESRGDFVSALALNERAEEAFRRQGDAEGVRGALQNRAEVCRKLGRLDEALLLLKEKEKLCLESKDRQGLARCLSLQAQILLTRDQTDAALPILEKQETLWREVLGDEGARASVRNIVQVLITAKKPERALDVLRWRMKRVDGGDEPAELRLFEGSVLAQELGRTEEGLAALDEARKLFEQLGLKKQVTIANELREKILSPAQHKDAASSNLPSSAEARALRTQAQGLQESGRIDEAISLLTRGLQLAPGDAPILHQRGFCHYKKEEFDQARNDFAAAIDADPAFYGNWFWRGMTELSLGQLDAALSDGEQALARKPNVADAHMLLARALAARSACHGWLQRQARREDITRGLEHLDRALQCGYSRLDIVRHDPHLEPLRRDPRFAEIMGRRPKH